MKSWLSYSRLHAKERGLAPAMPFFLGIPLSIEYSCLRPAQDVGIWGPGETTSITD